MSPAHTAAHAPRDQLTHPTTTLPFELSRDAARQAPLRHVAGGVAPFTTAYLRVGDDALEALLDGGVPPTSIDAALERLATLRTVDDVETHALVSSSDGRFAVRAFHEPIRRSQVTVGRFTRLGPWLELSALSPSMLVLLADGDRVEVLDVGPGAIGPSSRNLGLLSADDAVALADRIDPDVAIVVGADESMRRRFAFGLADAGAAQVEFIDPSADDEPLAHRFTRIAAHHASQASVSVLAELRSARSADLVVEGHSLIGHQLSEVLRLVATDDVESERRMLGRLPLVDSVIHRAVGVGVPVSMVPTVKQGGPLSGVAAIRRAR